MLLHSSTMLFVNVDHSDWIICMTSFGFVSLVVFVICMRNYYVNEDFSKRFQIKLNGKDSGRCIHSAKVTCIFSVRIFLNCALR